MSGSTLTIFLGVVGAWSGAWALKALLAMRGGTPYVFATWDGGVLRAGRQLTPRGVIAKLTLGALLVAFVLGWVLGLLPAIAARMGILGLLLAAQVCDFTMVEPTS